MRSPYFSGSLRVAGFYLGRWSLDPSDRFDLHLPNGVHIFIERRPSTGKWWWASAYTYDNTRTVVIGPFWFSYPLGR